MATNSNLQQAARAIIYQRDYKAEHGYYDARQPNPDAEPHDTMQFDDWAADILETALASDGASLDG